MFSQPGAKIPTPQTLSEDPLEESSEAGGGGVQEEQSTNPAPCQECYCGPTTDPSTKLNIITCKPFICNTSCAEVRGFITTHLIQVTMEQNTLQITVIQQHHSQ